MGTSQPTRLGSHSGSEGDRMTLLQEPSVPNPQITSALIHLALPDYMCASGRIYTGEAPRKITR